LTALLVLDIHRAWAWFVILGNALAGVWSLAAHKWPTARSRALWWYIALVEIAVFVQVILGVTMVSHNKLVAPQFHMFYGFVAIISIGIIYSYRNYPFLQGKTYLLYGLGSLFVMGLGIRAFLQA
jgi:Co/Zn/Cd efflux system component